VVVLADRDGTDVIAHAAGDQGPARRFEVGDRPYAQHDPHPDRPPAQHHGERHLTDSEPESGGQRNAEFIAGRVAEAADSVAAHVVIGAGDEHILDAIGSHLPETTGPVTAITGGRAADGLPRCCAAVLLGEPQTWRNRGCMGYCGGGEVARTIRPTTTPARKPNTCAR